MLHLTRPKDFNPRFEVVSCFFECDGKILLLHRQDHKPQGNTWGMPSGKVEPGETKEQAMIKEIREETGYQALLEDLEYFQSVFVQYPDFDFLYHMFHLICHQQPPVRLSRDEHKDFCWVTPQEALQLPLIPDLDACIKLFYKI